MPEHEQPNLDLIRMVQQARMQHDAEAKPSEVAAVYWIEVKPKVEQTPTLRAGDWVIPTTVDAVDALWEKIKAATAAGKLGYKSKVSTASHTEDRHAREIRVRTVDSVDAEDVQRVRDALRALGVGDEITYIEGR